jgi:hypothetical protein
MKCNIYSTLGLISIILIISIMILVYYKNMKDNNTKDYNIEGFHDRLDDMIIANNKLLNTNLNNLISTKINVVSNPNIIDKQLQSNIAKKIVSNTDDIAKTYNKNNKINDKLITDLEGNITDLENIVNNKIRKNLTSTKYSTIKSMNNGMEVNLFNTPNTVYKDPRSGIMTNSFLVGINNGCLSVGVSDYDVYKCNDKNVKQQFKLQHIINNTEYKQNVDKAVNFDNIDTSNVKYPFVMVKSVNNDNCLTNTNGNITVQPCYGYEAQRWTPL